MRAFGVFLVAVALALLAGAVIAYPAFELASTLGTWAFHRVAGRIGMLLLAVELVYLCRYLNIRGKGDFGFGLPRRAFIVQSLIWATVGIATASCGAAFLLGTSLRVLDAAFIPSPGAFLHLLLIGASSGAAVALIEETVMRGAMHTAIERESGPWAAALLTAALFAVLHFFAKVRIPPEEVGWGSGFVLLVRSFAPLGHPLLVLDSLLSWFAVGLVLSLTRILTGNIAVAIGLHAGWVFILRILQECTTSGRSAATSIWVGHFDGLIGYWILPWAFIIASALWLSRARWVPYATSDPR